MNYVNYTCKHIETSIDTYRRSTLSLVPKVRQGPQHMRHCSLAS
jgi:hypothetical protein